MNTLPDAVDSLPEPKRPRPWREKFADAFRGVKLGMRGHSSFSVHFFFATLVIAAAIVLRCELLEWCLLLGGIGLVFTAELFNSAIEKLCHSLDPEAKERARPTFDIAAGAVLVASLTAAIVGVLVFLPRLSSLLFEQ